MMDRVFHLQNFSQGAPYSTVQLTYEAAENIIRMQIVFFGIKMNNGLNYLNFRVSGFFFAYIQKYITFVLLLNVKHKTKTQWN